MTEAERFYLKWEEFRSIVKNKRAAMVFTYPDGWISNKTADTVFYALPKLDVDEFGSDWPPQQERLFQTICKEHDCHQMMVRVLIRKGETYAPFVIYHDMQNPNGSSTLVIELKADPFELHIGKSSAGELQAWLAKAVMPSPDRDSISE